jgi:prepilin-type N-terminal cleavage/methylation domain-containing protein
MASIPTHRGFTLMELLVVITVIAILLSLLFPVISLVRESARSADCLANLRQIGTGIHAFAADNQGDLVPHDVGSSYYGRDWNAPGFPIISYPLTKYRNSIWAQVDYPDATRLLIPPYLDNMRSNALGNATSGTSSRSAFVCRSAPKRVLSYSLNSLPFSEGNPGLTPLDKYTDPKMQWATYLKQSTDTGTYAVWYDTYYNSGNSRTHFEVVKLAAVNPRRAMLWDSWVDKTLVDHGTPKLMLNYNGQDIWHRDRKISLWFLDGSVKRGTRTQGYYSAIYPSSPKSTW